MKNRIAGMPIDRQKTDELQMIRVTDKCRQPQRQEDRHRMRKLKLYKQKQEVVEEERAAKGGRGQSVFYDSLQGPHPPAVPESHQADLPA